MLLKESSVYPKCVYSDSQTLLVPGDEPEPAPQEERLNVGDPGDVLITGHLQHLVQAGQGQAPVPVLHKELTT